MREIAKTGYHRLLDMRGCEPEEEHQYRRAHEEVGYLAERPIFQEADVPVFGLDIGIDGWRKVGAPGSWGRGAVKAESRVGRVLN